MEDIKLTPEEQNLLASVENDEWLSVLNLKQEVKRYQGYARAQLELQEIKIELPIQDLQFLQALAHQSDTSIQIVIANLVNQFIAYNTATSPKKSPLNDSN